MRVLDSILLIKTSALGDVIHTYPTVQYLRRCYPQAHIGWVVERPCAELVTAHPAVDVSYTVDTKTWRRQLGSLTTWRSMRQCRRCLRERSYDLVLDLQGNTKSALFAMQVRSAEKVGFAAGYVAERPNLWAMNRHVLPPPGHNIRDDYLYLARTAIQGPVVEEADFAPVALRIAPEQCVANQVLVERLRRGHQPVGLLFGGSAWPNKQLTSETLTAFATRAEQELGICWLLAWGSAAEHNAVRQLQRHLSHGMVLERLPLPQLQHLLSLADLAVSMDSLPLHLAATTRVPTYSFFGPSSSAKYAPQGPHHTSWQGPCPYGTTFSKRCPKLRSCPTGLCLRHDDASAIYTPFAQWWQQQASLGKALPHMHQPK